MPWTSRGSRRADRWDGTAAPAPAPRRRTRPSTAAEDDRAVRLQQPEQQAAHQRAADVADAAEHGRGERLDAGQEADVEAGGLEEDHEQEPGGAGEDAAEQERERHDAVDVDAHQLRRLGVLGGGADAAAEAAAVHELVEHDHEDQRGHEDEHLVGADLGALEREHRRLLQHPLRADAGAAVAQGEELLEHRARCRWR